MYVKRVVITNKEIKVNTFFTYYILITTFKNYNQIQYIIFMTVQEVSLIRVHDIWSTSQKPELHKEFEI